MLIGHWIEMKSVLGASKALEKLARLLPDTVHLIQNEKIKDVNISEIKREDLVLVKAGEKIPADGIIMKGNSYLDESMLTGESKPIQKKKGDKVIGGSVNGDSVLEVKVVGTGEDSYINKVINLVKDTQASKSKTQRLADKAAKWLTIIAVTAGVGTFIYWVIYGLDLAFAIERMATVMVITCPHALGLAIPLVTAVSTSLSAKNGLLIRNRTAFENSRNITTVVFDKTGTLTEGKFGVTSITIFDNSYNEKRIIELASSLEKNSEHPIAKGIIEKAKQLNVKDTEVTNFKTLKGEGIEGQVNGDVIRLVSQKHVIKNNMQVTKSNLEDGSGTLVYVTVNDKIIGLITLADKIREESYEAIRKLQGLGIKCWMLTLAQADVGIAIGSGTDVAAETADIILVNSNPKDVVLLILFGKATYNKIIQNLFWATGYNVVAIPLAAGIFYNIGLVISPAIGAALMSLSTVIVAINANFLKVKK